MRKPERVFVALVAALCTLALLCAGYMAGSRVARKRINEKLAYVGKKLGAPIEIGQTRLGLGTATFDDVRIGDDASLVISRVTVELSLNPFSPRFGELDALTIHRIKVKTAVDRLEGQVRRLAGDSLDTAGVSAKARHSLEKLFQAMPTDKLWLKSGSIVVANAQGQPLTTVRGLQLLIEKRESKVLFRVASIKTESGFAEEHLQGRFQLVPKSGHYRFFVRKKRSANGKANDWSVSGRLAKSLSEAELRVDLRRLPAFLASAAAPLLGDKPQLNVTGTVSARRDPEGPWRFDTKVTSKDTRLLVPVLASTPIGPVRFDLVASGFYKPDERIIAIEEAVASIPPKASRSEPVRIRVSGAGRIGDLFQWRDMQTNDLPLAGFSWQGHARLLDASCQSVVDASPVGFTPALDGFKLDGKTGGAISLRFDGDKPDSLVFELSDLRWTCRVTEAPYEYSTQHLSGPFTLQRPVGKGEDGKELEPIEVSVSPLSPGYTPLSHIAKNVNNTFIASEDAGFYTHKGIDSFALENAARKNFAEKRVAVGGSTITMQTVKNLFLTHERTVSRKLQELFLAWHLENILDKDRILEIYLNIVEYGPGIYGITQAAEHFFGKHPYDLGLMESAYLASLLPSPKLRYRSFCAGKLTPGMRELVQSLLKRMVGLGRLTWDRYGQATAQSLHFNDVERQSSRECARGDAGAS
jgi:hypothetical protein